MKFLIFFLFLFASNLVLAQGLIFSTLQEKPKVLMLEKMYPWDGDSYLVHVEENPLTHVKILFQGEQLIKLQDHLIKSDSSRIFCDGNFSFAYDFHGQQYLDVSSISVCIDENGMIIAHSFGKSLQPHEIYSKVTELSKSIKKKKIGGEVFEGSEVKDVNGGHSSGKSSLNRSSNQ
jgi:hypothetical protein